MNVLTEIVSLLADENESLTNGLYKIKLLATRVKNEELLKWVNSELNGYETEKELPKYRLTSGILKGSFTNGFHTQINQSIPTFNFPEQLRDFVYKIPILQNISIVEDYANRSDDTIPLAVPAEISAFIMEFIRGYNKSVQGYRLYNNHILVSTKAYKDILMKVRNNALDLILALESEIGFEVDINEVIKKKDKVNQVIQNYMSQNNITNIGDGNLVNTGDHNDITQNTVIQKGNFEQLKQALSQAGLDTEDIDNLEKIIKDDNPNLENKELGDGVKDWLKKVTLKYWDKGKKIGLGAITSIATDLIGKFVFGV